VTEEGVIQPPFTDGLKAAVATANERRAARRPPPPSTAAPAAESSDPAASIGATG
jgi:hypothetical protein